MPDLSLEAQCPGPVCGVDEAGRGPWAGPVSAGAVILDPDRVPQGLNDSKKLTAKARERLEIEIKTTALAWGVGLASAQEIDEIDILQATGLAMRRAIAALRITPAFALVDGNYRFDLPCPLRPVVRGDSLSASIAAASILAKVERDRIMRAAHLEHPQYGFDRHKGYHAASHVAALKAHGPCHLHRRTWAPIRALS
ncbi:MAG: ribonuclease HII [Phenylobacterium zucineum]|nr:MAG: ribonuclease HII [Phenylobacterium zucineum]